jgi:hypothetical protein
MAAFDTATEEGQDGGESQANTYAVLERLKRSLRIECERFSQEEH